MVNSNYILVKTQCAPVLINYVPKNNHYIQGFPQGLNETGQIVNNNTLFDIDII